MDLDLRSDSLLLPRPLKAVAYAENPPFLPLALSSRNIGVMWENAERRQLSNSHFRNSSLSSKSYFANHIYHPLYDTNYHCSKSNGIGVREMVSVSNSDGRRFRSESGASSLFRHVSSSATREGTKTNLGERSDGDFVQLSKHFFDRVCRTRVENLFSVRNQFRSRRRER